MYQAYATRLAPATIDAILLAGLREQRGPVEEEAIPDVCHCRYETLPDDRQASLKRLVERGLVDRRKIRKRHADRPLIEWTEVTVYQATGGGK